MSCWHGWLLPLLSQGLRKSEDAEWGWVGPSPAAKLLPHTQEEKRKAGKVEGDEQSWQLMLLSAGLQGSRVCSLYACLPSLRLLSRWVFPRFFWLPLITVIGVKFCPLLSSW